MLMRAVLLVLCGLASAPAFAGEAARPRLVVGGMDLSHPEIRNEMFAAGDFSAGSVSGMSVMPDRNGGLIMGGYAAYAFHDLQFSSSLKGNSSVSAADFGASYDGGILGLEGIAAFRLGYEWGALPQAFSVNPAQAGLSDLDGIYDPTRPVSDLSLTFSFTHDVTPALSLGGFAAAGRQGEDGQEPESSLRFGAGVGVKF
jgi:hypothetical protein